MTAMTALIAILLQVGPPPTACAVSHALATGTAAPCDGVLIPPKEAASSAKLCDLRVETAQRIGDARVKACSASVELLHVTLDSVRGIFDASQGDATVQLAEVEIPVCPWYECPGWTLAGGLGVVVGGAVAWAMLR